LAQSNDELVRKDRRNNGVAGLRRHCTPRNDPLGEFKQTFYSLSPVAFTNNYRG